MKIDLFNDNFENAKVYQLPKADLIVADIPYNIGKDAYASRAEWWNGREYRNGENKERADKRFFNTDENFNIENFFKFCIRYLKDEPKKGSGSPSLLVFCSFEQIAEVIDSAYKVGLKKYIPIILIKNNSSQVLKANMKIVGACEYCLLFYRNKLPKFNNVMEDGKKHMIKNWFEFKKDPDVERIHPTQKPVNLLEKLIRILTDENDVIIDPVAGSGSTLIASYNLNRNCYGFEVDRNYYNKAIKLLSERGVLDGSR